MTTAETGALMDAIYRRQRHIYDATRKYYLLGRDRLIERLEVPAGGSVLEVGCGTARNLIAVARRYPDARLYGFDISPAMLEKAEDAVARAGLAGRIHLAQADAATFDPQAAFGEAGFDRVFLSYTLSMIPPWQAALARGMDVLNEGGRLSVVDFGGQERLPGWFRKLLRAWLAQFHVTPRDSLAVELETAALQRGWSAGVTSLHRGYAITGEARRPAP
ncbi:methyltransferase domain-containing protein [Stappia sp. F7233]|uniref:Methyltransferase domain-containing protein n=1 Tax=Stappia albiluteola TaxID=2758565 RepID=A0A839AKE6_9HYPH|nr:class I SAM-dependent methyltransferase [Stappia albiluteola]MBA5779267.1 methyltransferase domain-containing protein [Stappia albiluteola]